MSSLRNLALSTLLFGAPGCFGSLGAMNGGPPPTVASKALSAETLAKSVEPADIAVIQGKSELPRGLFFYQDQAVTKLYALPDYPSVQSHHLVLAAMATSSPAYPQHQRAVLDEYKKQASEMGANAVFIPQGNPNLAFAVYTSSATPPASTMSVEQGLKQEEAKLKAYRRLGSSASLALGNAQLDVDTQKARCYAMSVVLHDDAKLNDTAQGALFVSLESSDSLLGNRSLGGPVELIANPDDLPIQAPLHGRFVNMRSFSSELGCASSPVAAHVQLWTNGKVVAIGEGEASVQLYERRISNSELSAMQAEQARQIEEARIAAEEQRRADEEMARQRERERADQERADRERADREAQQASSNASSSSSGYFSFSLKNECSQTVKLFIGDKPKYGSGTSTSVSSNSINSYSGSGSQTYWIVDESGNGLSSFTAGAGQRDMRILPSCTGFAPR